MILPLIVPIRLEGEKDIRVDGSWYTLVDDEPVELDMTEVDEGAKIELDAARATGSSSAPVYAPPTIRPESSAQDPIEPPTRRRISDLYVGAIYPSVRAEEIIAESRKAHIDHLLESCSVKELDVAEADCTICGSICDAWGQSRSRCASKCNGTRFLFIRDGGPHLCEDHGTKTFHPAQLVPLAIQMMRIVS